MKLQIVSAKGIRERENYNIATRFNKAFPVATGLPRGKEVEYITNSKEIVINTFAKMKRYLRDLAFNLLFMKNVAKNIVREENPAISPTSVPVKWKYQ